MQMRRAGAVGIAKAVADKADFKSLELDGNEISEAAVDDIKVSFTAPLRPSIDSHQILQTTLVHPNFYPTAANLTRQTKIACNQT